MKYLLALLVTATALFALTGYYTGESTNGMSKICYYDTVRGTMAITIESYEICPISVKF